MEHAWAIGVEMTTWSVHHVFTHKFVQFRVNCLVRYLTGHNCINMLCCSRFVCIVLHNEKQMNVWQPTFLQKQKRGYLKGVERKKIKVS